MNIIKQHPKKFSYALALLFVIGGYSFRYTWRTEVQPSVGQAEEMKRAQLNQAVEQAERAKQSKEEEKQRAEAEAHATEQAHAKAEQEAKQQADEFSRLREQKARAEQARAHAVPTQPVLPKPALQAPVAPAPRVVEAKPTAKAPNASAQTGVNAIYKRSTKIDPNGVNARYGRKATKPKKEQTTSEDVSKASQQMDNWFGKLKH